MAWSTSYWRAQIHAGTYVRELSFILFVLLQRGFCLTTDLLELLHVCWGPFEASIAAMRKPTREPMIGEVVGAGFSL